MDRRASSRETDSRLFETLGRIEANQEHIKENLLEMKPLVDKHETAYKIGKFATVPALAAFHIGVKHLLSKVGL